MKESINIERDGQRRNPDFFQHGQPNVQRNHRQYRNNKLQVDKTVNELRMKVVNPIEDPQELYIEERAESEPESLDTEENRIILPIGYLKALGVVGKDFLNINTAQFDATA